MNKLVFGIAILLLVSCDSDNGYENFKKSRNFNLLFADHNTNICFANETTVKEIIDSLHYSCKYQNYTGNYNLQLHSKEKQNKVGIKGFVCPHSLLDYFYNPLNIFLIKGESFVEESRNSHDPISSSTEFGEYIYMNNGELKNLIHLPTDSLLHTIGTHLEIAYLNYTYPALIQIIADENVELIEIEFIFDSILKAYYELYDSHAEMYFEKSLDKLDFNELKELVKRIDVNLHCNIRLNSFQRLEKMNKGTEQ